MPVDGCRLRTGTGPRVLRKSIIDKGRAVLLICIIMCGQWTFPDFLGATAMPRFSSPPVQDHLQGKQHQGYLKIREHRRPWAAKVDTGL